MAKAIRTNKWVLSANERQKVMLRSTAALYRAYIKALVGVAWLHLPGILGAKIHCTAVERLIHSTRKNPNPKHRYFDSRFPKFPPYLRRPAIEAVVRQSTEFVNPPGTSKHAFDGSGEVKRESGNRSLATFTTGKRYNADLSACYNIGARFYARVLGLNAIPFT